MRSPLPGARASGPHPCSLDADPATTLRAAPPALTPSATLPPMRSGEGSRSTEASAAPPRSWPLVIPGFGANRAEFIRTVLADADVIIELPGGIPLPFRRVPHRDTPLPYLFRMGSRDGEPSEEPVHRVVLRQAVYLAVFPVTQTQWRAVVKAWGRMTVGDPGAPEPLNADPSEFKGDDRPVEQVSWHDAAAWCDVLQRRLRSGLESRAQPGLQSGLPSASSHAPVHWRDGVARAVSRLRLPNESEWECGCRAGTRSEYSIGDGDGALRQAGWFDKNSGSDTHIVGTRRANRWGLFDVYGNVWEWCEDVWDANAYRKRAAEVGDETVNCGSDLTWPSRVWTLADAGLDATYWGEERRKRSDPVRVIRGGSWHGTAWRCRSPFRDRRRPDNRNRSQGFRPCLVPGPAQRAE